MAKTKYSERIRIALTIADLKMREKALSSAKMPKKTKRFIRKSFYKTKMLKLGRRK